MSSSVSDPQALSVRASLTLLSHTCALSIAAIDAKRDVQELPLSTLRADLISILSVIYSNTTKISIALNPAKPTYSAALTPLKDLTTYSSTLASNASSFLPNVHGRALTTEVHSTAKGVFTALQELVHAHLSLLADHASNDDDAVAISKPSSQNGNDAYLAKTAVVHELITQAKAEKHPRGLSKTNLIAVRKRWREHSEIIADAVETLEAEGSPSDGDDEDFDDGWDDPDLGLIVPGKLSPEQVELAKTITNVVSRTSALFHDILGAFLAPLRVPAQPPPNALLDDLLDSAPPLVAAVDNLATQVYGTPDDPSQLGEACDSFARALVPVTSAVKGFWKGKEDQRPTNEKGSQTYFIEQFTQLNIAVEAVHWMAPT